LSVTDGAQEPSRTRISAGTAHTNRVVPEPRKPSLRSAFRSELEDIRVTIARLAAQLTEDTMRATDVLLRQDVFTAERMIVADAEVDARCVDVSNRCYRLLALEAPVASDLRQVVADLRIVAEIERSSDLAVNICKAARRLHGHALSPRLRGLIRRMGEQAARLFAEASESYLLRDAVRAAAISDLDDDLDDLQREFVAEILGAHDDETIGLQVAVQLALVARYYERIGDHAVTIGERVRYLVTGTIGDWSPGRASSRSVRQSL